MINIGFIGLGGMGMHQVRSFAETRRCRIVAGADVSETGRSTFAKEQPQATVYEDYRKLLKDPKVDAVVIVTPTLLHKDIAIDAMRSGRAVLTEKPMARTVADCKRMLEVEAKTGKLMMVAHCRRFDTFWGKFADIYRSGKLGKIVVWRQMAGGKGPGVPWFMDEKLGGGPLIDGAVHNQDFANMLFGDPVSVVASSIKLTEATAVDTATAVIRYTSGCQLALNWSWGVAQAMTAHDVLGTRASLHFPGEHYTLIDRKTGVKKEIKYKQSNMYVTQAKHFIDCVEGKIKVCLSPGSEAIKAVASAEAILKAAPMGRERKVRW